jgi:hypothetical protein
LIDLKSPPIVTFLGEVSPSTPIKGNKPVSLEIPSEISLSHTRTGFLQFADVGDSPKDVLLIEYASALSRFGAGYLFRIAIRLGNVCYDYL